jgi:type II secretory pathway pseudopilin PulG
MRGFTLLEILLSISVIIVIGGIGIPIYHNLQIKNDLNDTAYRLVQMSRRAQALSRAEKNDSSWGVYIGEGSITLFQGQDYASRDAQYDETFEHSPAVTFSGDNEYTYTKQDGRLPSPVSLQMQAANENTVDVGINEMGNISY